MHVHTDGGAANDAVVDGGAAVLADLQAVVLVVRHRRGDVRRELQRQMPRVRLLGALHKHHRRLGLALQDHRLGHIAWRRP